MSRTYMQTTCPVCGARVSNNGLARTSHFRKHVREGRMKESTTPYSQRVEGFYYGSTFTVIKKPEETR